VRGSVDKFGDDCGIFFLFAFFEGYDTVILAIVVGELTMHLLKDSSAGQCFTFMIGDRAWEKQFNFFNLCFYLFSGDEL
jgi:hypothetical protein